MDVLEACLNKIEQRESVTIPEFDMLKSFIFNLLLHDYSAVLSTIKSNPNLVGLLPSYFFGKDRDYALRAYDFELAEEIFEYQLNNALSTIEYSRSAISRLISNSLSEFSLIFCPEYPQENLTEDKILLEVQSIIETSNSDIYNLEQNYIAILNDLPQNT